MKELDLCPVCQERALTGVGCWNMIIGEVCSVDCLTAYWDGKKGGQEMKKLDLVYVVLEWTGQGEDLVAVFKNSADADNCAAISAGRSVRVEEVEESFGDA